MQVKKTSKFVGELYNLKINKFEICIELFFRIYNVSSNKIRLAIQKLNNKKNEDVILDQIEVEEINMKDNLNVQSMKKQIIIFLTDIMNDEFQSEWSPGKGKKIIRIANTKKELFDVFVIEKKIFTTYDWFVKCWQINFKDLICYNDSIIVCDFCDEKKRIIIQLRKENKTEELLKVYDELTTHLNAAKELREYEKQIKSLSSNSIDIDVIYMDNAGALHVIRKKLVTKNDFSKSKYFVHPSGSYYCNKNLNFYMFYGEHATESSNSNLSFLQYFLLNHYKF
jgi:hypothetical protein